MLVTGKNGTGKSLILEALTAVWSGNINLPEFVGPYGFSLSIELAVVLEQHEYAAIDEWRSARGLAPALHSEQHVLAAISTNRESTGSYSVRDSTLETLQNPLFARDFPFASIDLLSARRQVSMTTSATVDLSMLDKAAMADQRRMMYDQEIRWKSAMQMPDIGTYLTSLDYRDYIASRQGEAVVSEYARLADLFFEATGKRIGIPAYDPSTARTSISVSLHSGTTHSLEDLSNGEREMLGMLYYVSQLSAQGGVLLLDEPEKHLHPSLQLAVLRAMMSVASRAQLIVVTHSPGLVASALSSSVLTVRAAWVNGENQIGRVVDANDQEEILFDLGITRRELLQASYLLIVEGVDDQKRLEMLFPDELASAKLVVAGSRDQALAMANSIKGLDLGLPWLCVIDRDFLSDAEVREIESRGSIFVWATRMLENVLLDARLIAASVAALGVSASEIESKMQDLIDEHRESAIEQFVRFRVERLVPDEPAAIDRLSDRIAQDLASQRQLWEYREREYGRIRTEVAAEVESEWPLRWGRYVDGKRVLAGLQKEFRVFAHMSLLVDDMMVRAREDDRILPSDCVRLRDLLREKITTSSPVLKFDESAVRIRDTEVEVAVSRMAPDPALNAPAPEVYPGC